MDNLTLFSRFAIVAAQYSNALVNSNLHLHNDVKDAPKYVVRFGTFGTNSVELRLVCFTGGDDRFNECVAGGSFYSEYWTSPNDFPSLVLRNFVSYFWDQFGIHRSVEADLLREDLEAWEADFAAGQKWVYVS